MAESTRKPADRVVETQRRVSTSAQKPEESAQLVVDESSSLSAASGDADDTAARYAAALRDPRLVEAGSAQRIRLMRQIQRSHGNSYAERVMTQVHPVADGAALQRKECAEPPPVTAPTAPERDARFRAVTAKARQVASKEKKHPPAATKSREAQAAAVPPANEVTSKAAANQVGAMSQQKPGNFDKAAFITKVEQAIAAITPKDEDEAAKFKESGKVGEAAGQVSSMVGQSKEGAEKGIKDKTEAAPDTSKVTPKPVTPMQPEQAGPVLGGVDGRAAMPQPKPAAQVSLAHTACQTDSQMNEAGVTEQQLKTSNEPAFEKAVDAKQDADVHARQAPQQFRQQEGATLQAARGAAAATTGQGLHSMHAGRAAALGHVGGDKQDTKSKDETKRADLARQLEAIYAATKTEITGILDGLTTRVDTMFGEGERQARATFENYVATQMAAYKKKRYSGFGKVLQVTDTLHITKLPPEVDKFYQKGRTDYLAAMRALIGRIADVVASELNRAKAAIAKGRANIDRFVQSQPKELQALAKEAANAIGGKFDQLEQDVDAKADALAQGLAQKYSDALKAVDDRIKQMQEANKSLLDRAKAAIGGAIQTILELKNMLLGVLARAAGVIDTIIKNPIGFLGNLISGVKQGLMGFVSNIGTHLKKGLMGWLFGEIAAAGIELPKSFDLKGMLTLVMQVLGLTWQSIRAQAVKILGEPVVKTLEGAFDIFMIIKDQGLGGLWEFIKEKLGDLKTMVIDGIKDMVITQVIQAGIQWLLSMLGGPAGAFVKAVKMIIDIVMWFVNNGSRMMGLVNAVLDSVSAIASGSLGAAAAKVEESLAKALPVAIGFLASLLGLGNLSGKIKGIIEKIQAPVQKAIGWVLGKAKGFAAKIGGGLKKIGGKIKGALGIKDETPEQKEKRLEAGVNAGVVTIDKLNGKPLTAMFLKGALGVIKLRYRLSMLEPFEKEGYWAVRGDIQRTKAGVSSVKVIDKKLAKFAESELKKIVDDARDALIKDKSRWSSLLSPREVDAEREKVWLDRLNFGKAVEYLVVNLVEYHPELKKLVKYLGGSGRIDFTGIGPIEGSGFEITTDVPSTIDAHEKRVWFDKNVHRIISYKRLR